MNMTRPLPGGMRSGPHNCPLSAFSLCRISTAISVQLVCGELCGSPSPRPLQGETPPLKPDRDRQETVTAQEEEVGCRDQEPLNLSTAPGLGMRLCARPPRG